MRTFYAVLLAATLAAPLPLAFHSYAMAGDALSTGDSHGPRQPSGQTEGTVTPPPVMLAQAKPTWPQEPWSYEAQTPKGFTDPRPHELSEQLARNHAYEFAAYNRIRENGGCNADYITFQIASYCNRGVFGDPMGSPGN